MALHVVKVYVCVWRRHVGSKASRKGEGKRKKEDETALTNTKR
jgi:hypothetical protein